MAQSLPLAVLCQARNTLSTLGVFVNYYFAFIFDYVMHTYSTKSRRHKRIQSTLALPIPAPASRPLPQSPSFQGPPIDRSKGTSLLADTHLKGPVTHTSSASHFSLNKSQPALSTPFILVIVLLISWTFGSFPPGADLSFATVASLLCLLTYMHHMCGTCSYT